MCRAPTFLLIVFLAASAVGADELKESPSMTRARHRKREVEPLAIREPVTIDEGLVWKDGGSIGLVLLDAKGKKHAFCLDGGGLPTREKPHGEREHNLVVGTTHPLRDGGKRIPLRGAEEAALYGVLLRWADRQPEREALLDRTLPFHSQTHGSLWVAREFLLRLDARYLAR